MGNQSKKKKLLFFQKELTTLHELFSTNTSKFVIIKFKIYKICIPTKLISKLRMQTPNSHPNNSIFSNSSSRSSSSSNSNSNYSLKHNSNSSNNSSSSNSNSNLKVPVCTISSSNL